MKRAVTAARMRHVEKVSAKKSGFPTYALMQSAGRELSRVAAKCAVDASPFLVVVGPGGNGGDGYLCAAALHQQGRAVLVWEVDGAVRLVGDPSKAKSEAVRCGVVMIQKRPPSPARGTVIIDAVFGTGLSRRASGKYLGAIRTLQRWRQEGCFVVSADVPSGLDADSGRVWGSAVEADVTVCFGYLKQGVCLEPGAAYAGRVEVVDIGLGGDAEKSLGADAVCLLEESDAARRLPVRRAESHKGTYGHALVVAGCREHAGAALLAATGALRSGAGLVTLASEAFVTALAVGRQPELMSACFRDGGALKVDDAAQVLEWMKGKQVLVLGPGLAPGPSVPLFVKRLLSKVDVPCVIDAEGLNVLAKVRSVSSSGPWVLTPHPGEAARLLGTTSLEVQRDRLGAVKAIARTYNATVVLKGARTLIADARGNVFINPTGNPGMASGGSGDVLAGMVGGLLAQGLSPLDACLVGVFAHGMAGDIAARTQGQLGLVASDLLASLGTVWRRWNR